MMAVCVDPFNQAILVDFCLLFSDRFREMRLDPLEIPMSIPFPKPAADVIAAPPLPPPRSEQQDLDRRDHPETATSGKDENAAGLLYQAELGSRPNSIRTLDGAAGHCIGI